MRNSEKREAQKTKPAKERLGTKPSDFRPRNQEPENNAPIQNRLGERQRNVWDRIEPTPAEVPSERKDNPVKQRLGKTNSEKREAQRKSRSERDPPKTPKRGQENPKTLDKIRQPNRGIHIPHSRRRFYRFRGRTQKVLPQIQRIDTILKTTMRYLQALSEPPKPVRGP